MTCFPVTGPDMTVPCCVLYTLILLAIRCDASTFPISNTIRFLQHANVTSCMNNITNHSLLADDALMTLNFQEYNNVYSVFQIPKCIFTSSVALQLMREINFSETLEMYKKRYRDYFLAALDGSYRFFGQTLSTPRSEHPKALEVLPTTQPHAMNVAVSKQNRVLYINGSSPHAIGLDNVLCTLFPNNRALFPVVIPCTRQIFTITKDVSYTVTFTNKFFVISIEESPEKYGHIIFGILKDVFVKAPYDKSTFMFRQTVKHDVMFVFTKSMTRGQYNHVTNTDFLSTSLGIDYENMTALYEAFDKTAVNMLLKRQCGKGNRWTHEILFIYGLIIYLNNVPSGNMIISASEFVLTQMYITAAQDFVKRCIDVKAIDLSFQHVVGIVHAILSGKLTHAPWVSGQFELELIYTMAKANGSITIAHDGLKAVIYEYMIQIHKTAMVRDLGRFERSMLYMFNEIVHATRDLAQLRRLISAIQTGICSPKELFFWTSHVYGGKHGLLEMYTPCAGSGRRDYTQGRMNSLFLMTLRKGIDTELLQSIFMHYQARDMSTFDQLACIPPNERYAAATLQDVTFIISQAYLVEGRTYLVSNTAVGNNVVVTAVQNNATCVRTNVMHDPASVTVAKNATATDKCEFCQSMLVEYDEMHGIINLIYLHDTQDLLFVTNIDNKMLTASPKTHYMMLTRNGSVIELTDIIVDIHEMSILLIVVCVIFAIVALFGIWRLFKFL